MFTKYNTGTPKPMTNSVEGQENTRTLTTCSWPRRFILQSELFISIFAPQELLLVCIFTHSALASFFPSSSNSICVCVCVCMCEECDFGNNFSKLDSSDVFVNAP